MNTVLDCVAEHLDPEAISAAFHKRESTKLSPPAFRYQLIQKARAANKRIVLPEGEEPRTVRAAVICMEKGIARCVLLGKRAVIETVAASQGITLPEGLEILDPDVIRGRYVEPMVELRKGKGLNAPMAVAQLEDTVVLGTMMLALDEVLLAPPVRLSRSWVEAGENSRSCDGKRRSGARSPRHLPRQPHRQTP